MHSPGYGTAEAGARAYGQVATLDINNRISWCGYAGPCQAKRINLKEIEEIRVGKELKVHGGCLGTKSR